MADYAFVNIWGERIGAVAWNRETASASFEYDQNIRNLKWNLSPIKMPIGSPNTIFSFPELRKKDNSEYDTFKGLPGLLADSLPDRYGSNIINNWLSIQGRPADSMNPVELLCFIGSRGMGALEFEPALSPISKNTFSIEIDSLVNTASELLKNKEKFTTNLQNDQEKALQQILKIGTSAGGARPKAIIAYNPATGEVKSGQTKVPKGFEHWIIKLDGVESDQLSSGKGYGRIEMAYHLMALDCGITMMISDLIEENGRAHFITKRFDREENNIKHHIQTFCALQHFDYNYVGQYSYEQLFQTMRQLKLSYPEAEEMFRRMVFNIAARNCDDHTKNFSFMMKKNQTWQLAPAYDLCFSYNPKSIWVSKHSLSINGKREGITKKDLLHFAKNINIKRAEQIISDINYVVSNWKKYASQTGIEKKKMNAISDLLIQIS